MIIFILHVQRKESSIFFYWMIRCSSQPPQSHQSFFFPLSCQSLQHAVKHAQTGHTVGISTLAPILSSEEISHITYILEQTEVFRKS